MNGLTTRANVRNIGQHRFPKPLAISWAAIVALTGLLMPVCRSAPGPFEPVVDPRPFGRVAGVVDNDASSSAILTAAAVPPCDRSSGRCTNWLPIMPEQSVEYGRTRESPPRPELDRLAKKDVFVSRGWGAGGMPFSVLYMNPRVNHSPPTGSSQVDAGKAKTEANRRSKEPPPVINRLPPSQPNYQVALRNGSPGQPRRQYSIIPQLFISYGWGPSGK